MIEVRLFTNTVLLPVAKSTLPGVFVALTVKPVLPAGVAPVVVRVNVVVLTVPDASLPAKVTVPEKLAVTPAGKAVVRLKLTVPLPVPLVTETL